MSILRGHLRIFVSLIYDIKDVITNNNKWQNLVAILAPITADLRHRCYDSAFLFKSLLLRRENHSQEIATRFREILLNFQKSRTHFK